MNRSFWIYQHALYDFVDLNECVDFDKSEVLSEIKLSNDFDDLSRCLNEHIPVSRHIYNKMRNDMFIQEESSRNIETKLRNSGKKEKYSRGQEDIYKQKFEPQQEDPYEDIKPVLSATAGATSLYLLARYPKQLINAIITTVSSVRNLLSRANVGSKKAIEVSVNPNFWRTSGSALLAIGGVLAVSIAAYQLYDRFMSNAAKNCSKLTGRQKTICMLKFKIQAARLSLSKWNESDRGCLYTKNIVNCQTKVRRHISRWEDRIMNYEKKLRILSSKGTV